MTKFFISSYVWILIFCGVATGDSTEIFSSEELQSISYSMKNKAFFFIGYPGSGKGTQGKEIAHLLNINHLSTGELFRAEAKKGTPIGLQMDLHMQRGEIIPKELSFQYLKQELSNPKYRKGFILDGYPKDIECFYFIIETLNELGFEATIAFNFEISRDAVVYRLTERLHCEQCEKDYHKEFLKPEVEGICDICRGLLKPRPDDFTAAINKRLDVFEKNTRSVVDSFNEMGILVRLDAVKDPKTITEDILRIFFQNGVENKVINSKDSYFLNQLKGEENSSVFHNHIDAKSHQLLKKIVEEIEKDSLEIQNKIYPVGYLTLGPQIVDPHFAFVYQSLPNFHFINDAVDEAFSTGKMGEIGFDYDQVLKTLEVASLYPNCGVMTELEEEIFERSFDANSISTVTLDRGNTSYSIDWLRLPGWKEKMIANLPKFELHHGFDIIKLPGEELPPIEIGKLSSYTSLNGFNTGGWFVFRKGDRWAYRSNEFSNEEYTICVETLESQANNLRDIVAKFLLDRSFTSSCSLEKVHAMWHL